MPKLRLLLDLDGVLADFNSAAAIVHNLTPEEMYKHHKPGEWSIVPALSKALGKELDEDSFWEPIHAMEDAFWESLQPTPWYSDLMFYINGHVIAGELEWFIVTAPSQCHSSYAGKVKWMKQRFGRDFDSFHITRHKHHLANLDTILIDDRNRNCKEFRKAGGGAILFPSIGNKYHHDALLGRQVKRIKEELSLVLDVRSYQQERSALKG